MPSAGDLLRAVPTRRNLRLERVVYDGSDESIEAVRAAETLFGLQVRLRLLNDPDVALALVIRDAERGDREEFRELGLDEPAPDDIEVYAEITMDETAVRAGYVALADDVLCGLEQVFGDGVAWSPATDEVFVAAAIARMMDSEDTPWTHLDVELAFEGERLRYVGERLTDELPGAMTRMLRRSDHGIELRGRFPAALDPDEYRDVWTVLLELAPFASAGHIRFREKGTWSDIVEGIGGDVADVPEEWAASRRGIRGVISRLFSRD